MTQSEKQKLLPCPFPAVWTNGSLTVSENRCGGFMRVQCTSCGTCGPLAKTENEAIAAWNTRAITDERRDWRPISTLARDGKNVLFYCDNDVRKGYADEWGFHIVNNGDYHDGGYGSDYQCDDKNKSSDYGYSIPTHWMPLPQPPTAAGDLE
jgi:hypothetical protein